MSETPKAKLKATNGRLNTSESYNIKDFERRGVGHYVIHFKEPIGKSNIITRIKSTIMKIIKRKRK